MVYEAKSADDDYSLKVELSTNQEGFLPYLRCVSGWSVTFLAPSNQLKAVVHYQTPTADFYSFDGQPRGRVHEANFSVVGKSLVEDEAGRQIGSIRWGLRKDRILSAAGQVVGLITRASTEELPTILPPSSSHLVERFEFVHESDADFDERLLYAFICRLVFMERTSGG